MAEYIGRETAYEDFEKCNSENPKWTPSRVKTLIARQKAADVTPVRHGWWIKREHDDGYGPYDLYHCSECDAATAHNQMNFCYNCGSDMREVR